MPSMNWDTLDWSAITRLRRAFLDGTAGDHDYWRSDTDLSSYDQTFAQRIGWKWDYVLEELTRRGWSPPGGAVLDWGCGTGIASRVFLKQFRVGQLYLSDRSPLALQFAVRRVREEFPDVAVWAETSPPAQVDTLVVSHVLTELSEAQLATVRALVRTATAVLWVEPGTMDCSRQLIALRENVRDQFAVVAPCPHQAACGLLTPANNRHWCHHFAPSPPAVFTDGNWARFARLAGIDLRSLPLSYLVLDRRPAPPPAEAARMLGRPRVYKAHAQVLTCSADGVREVRLTKRDTPAEFRRLKKWG